MINKKPQPGDIYALKKNIKPHGLNLYIINVNNECILLHGSCTGMGTLQEVLVSTNLKNCIKVGTVKDLSDLVLKEVFND